MDTKSPANTSAVPFNRQISWSVMQRADDPDIARANHQLKTDIANGARGVALVFEGAHNAFGFGLPAKSDTIARLFGDIDLDGLHIRVDNHPHGRAVTDQFIDYLQHRRFNPNRTNITFGTDSTATLATTGKLRMSIAALNASLPQLMSVFFSSGLPGIVLEADGRPYHNAGATAAQEIGAMLSVALGHLKMVESARHHILYALPHIGFATSVDQNLTLGLAKLRALQLLWYRIQKERGVPNPIAATIHVETSMRMMTERDLPTNIIRTAIAAQTAILGGASSLSVLPYSSPCGLPDAAARREALMCQLILAEEGVTPLKRSAVRHSSDAEALADTAWAEYQRFEAEGGVMQSLLHGGPAMRFQEAQDLRIAAYLKGERAILGTTQSRLEKAGPFGIYDQKPVEFEAEGLVHCAPLSTKRLDVCFEESKAMAPIEAASNI